MMQSTVVSRLAAARHALDDAGKLRVAGRVAAVGGAGVHVAGLDALLALGDRVSLQPPGAPPVTAEVVGLQPGRACAMPLGAVAGLGPGTQALLVPRQARASLPVHDGWLGRIIDPLGQPLDGKGALPPGPPRPVRAAPPPAAQRARLGPARSLGVRALDAFVTCREGQRLGLFAGSGVGKSTLLAMLARHAETEIVVAALVGERGREVREFIEDDLGPAMNRTVAVVATSDQPPMLRREAAYAAMAIAEHFRDQGRSVLLLMDSVTRFCLALREIGLAAGEVPATRGYPPSVFAELPCLLERAGPAEAGNPGHITGIFTVLVEGDDHNEPVSDAVRGILDGHAVLDRRIAEAGRYPAIDVLRSLSRTVPSCLTAHQAALAGKARALLAIHAELADLVRLGAYRPGADAEADAALRLAPAILGMLNQRPGDPPSGIDGAFASLAKLLEEHEPA